MKNAITETKKIIYIRSILTLSPPKYQHATIDMASFSARSGCCSLVQDYFDGPRESNRRHERQHHIVLSAIMDVGNSTESRND